MRVIGRHGPETVYQFVRRATERARRAQAIEVLIAVSGQSAAGIAFRILPGV